MKTRTSVTDDGIRQGCNHDRSIGFLVTYPRDLAAFTCVLSIIVSAIGCGSSTEGRIGSGVLFVPAGQQDEVAYRAAGVGGGGVVVLGKSSGDLDLGGGQQAKGGMFVLRLDRDGRYLWDSRFSGFVGPADLDGRFGNEGIGFPTGAIASGSGDNVFVAGSFGGDTDFGGGVRSSHLSDYPQFGAALDVVVLKLAPDGQRLWDWTFGQDYFESFATEIAAGPDGGAVVAVMRHPDSTFCNADPYWGPMLCDGSEAILVKLSADGVPVWQDVLPGGYVTGLAIDAAGNVLVASRCHFLKIRPDGTHAFDVDGLICGGTGLALHDDNVFFTGNAGAASTDPKPSLQSRADGTASTIQVLPTPIVADPRLTLRSQADGSVLWNRALPILPTRVRADSEGNVVLLSDVVYGYSGVSLAGGTYDFGCGALKVEYMGVVAAVLDGSGVCRSDYVSESVGGFIRGLDVAPSGDRFAWVIGGFAGEVLFENGYRTGTRTYDSNPHGEDSQDVFVERFDF